jgi:hypothetical protein
MKKSIIIFTCLLLAVPSFGYAAGDSVEDKYKGEWWFTHKVQCDDYFECPRTLLRLIPKSNKVFTDVFDDKCISFYYINQKFENREPFDKKLLNSLRDIQTAKDGAVLATLLRIAEKSSNVKLSIEDIINKINAIQNINTKIYDEYKITVGKIFFSTQVWQN